MPVPIFQVDAFTTEAYRGNPAAVCLLQTAAPEVWMQAVAAEMNLSETAFLVPQVDGFDLRWFTPAAEVDLCGHATLASAHILWETETLAPGETARFHTRSGLLTATRQNNLIALDFPTTPAEACSPPPDLLAALGVEAQYVGRNRFDYLVQVDSAATVRALQPDLARLKILPVRGVIVTAAADDSQTDFVSRFFAPAVGVDEDPVTGSAHCCLGIFWQERLGKDTLQAHQVSARGGRLEVQVSPGRTCLRGAAVTIFQGELRADP